MRRKPRRFASSSQLRAGIGDGDEMRARLARAERRLGAREEILHQDVGLERRARLARDDVERARGIDAPLDSCGSAPGSVEIEHQQLRRARAGARTSRRSPRARGSIRPCRAAAMCAKSVALHLGGEALERVDARRARARRCRASRAKASSPPVHSAARAPTGAAPCRRRASRRAPRQRRASARGSDNAARRCAAVEQRHALSARPRARSLSAASAKSRTPSSTSFCAHRLERDAAALRASPERARPRRRSLRACRRALAVVAERVHRRGRHGVDRIAADQAARHRCTSL